MNFDGQSPWLAAAWGELGQTEIAGGADNPRIVGYFRDVGHRSVVDDETAWCAAFAGAMLERTGQTSTRSLRARSYLDWGTAIDAAPRMGCVAILSRGSDPALGHVGFLVGLTDDRVVLLGGNQSNAVTVQGFARSRLLGLRWPDRDAQISVSPTPVPTPAPAPADDARFAASLAHVLVMEGGFSDDPYDPGGPTNFGITLKTFATYVGKTLDGASLPSLRAQLRAIDQATVRAIYKQRYWIPAQCSQLPAGLDLFHFDAAVNHGVGGAIRFLQRAVNVEPDGAIGPLTLRAIGLTRSETAIERYAQLREQRYRALPHFWRFGRGWLRRVTATKAAAFAQLQPEGAPSQTTLQPKLNRSTPGDETMTDAATPTTKWWGHSLTVWGAFVTAAAAILPTLGPLVGLDITSESVRQIGSDAGAIVQAVAGLLGTLMTLYGRARATAPLVRRDMTLRL